MSNSANPVEMLLQQMQSQQVGSAVENTYQFLKGHMAGTAQDKKATFTSPYTNLKTITNRNNNDNEDSKHTAKTYPTKINTWKGVVSKDQEESAKAFFMIDSLEKKEEIKEKDISNLFSALKQNEADLAKRKATSIKSIKKANNIESALFDKISNQPIYATTY
jgi:hypothetical protein|tara:strand:- start:166 stop:654 length:489 start_codon:yes stop_codon:yes gene_type:complete